MIKVKGFLKSGLASHDGAVSMSAGGVTAAEKNQQKMNEIAAEKESGRSAPKVSKHIEEGEKEGNNENVSSLATPNDSISQPPAIEGVSHPFSESAEKLNPNWWPSVPFSPGFGNAIYKPETLSWNKLQQEQGVIGSLCEVRKAVEHCG
jgi:hypothetical protein